MTNDSISKNSVATSCAKINACTYRQGTASARGRPVSYFRSSPMPRGDKSSYSDKQKRQAEHIEEGYEDRGVGKGEAERRAWATVNAMTHGGKKSGSGRGRSEDHAAARK